VSILKATMQVHFPAV